MRSGFCEEGNEHLNIIQITFTFQQILAVILSSILKITVKIQQLPNCSPLLYAQNLPLPTNCFHFLTVYSATHLYQNIHEASYNARSYFSLVSLSSSCCKRCSKYHIYFQRYFISSQVTETRRNDSHYQQLISVAITQQNEAETVRVLNKIKRKV